ncbi:MAG: hypothetical protein O2985_13815, partial [Proteobacteria bacterium]|nr:hypothetical protein [Pseudomonadota bacterium]
RAAGIGHSKDTRKLSRTGAGERRKNLAPEKPSAERSEIYYSQSARAGIDQGGLAKRDWTCKLLLQIQTMRLMMRERRP